MTNTNVNGKAKHGMTSFILACFYRHKDVDKLILKDYKRTELNTRQSWKVCINFACYKRHNHIVQIDPGSFQK